MALEAKVFFGEGNLAMPADAIGWLVEIRVEQELNKPTKFALRFEDDLCEGQPAMQARDEIAPGTILTVIAGAGEVEPVCLARGPITRIRSSATVGGPGSWVEAHCETRHVEMDRVPVSAKWTGAHKGIVEGLLAHYDFTPDVADVEGTADESSNQLNQSGTDFAFLNKMASDHGVDFWLSYEAVDMGPLALVAETAHFRISPSTANALPGAAGGFTLFPEEDAPVLRLNTVGRICRTVDSFEAEADLERPTSGQVSTVDTSQGRAVDQPTVAEPETQGEGSTVESFGSVQRTITTNGPGGPEQQTRRQEAALRAAAWFVEGKATTSAQLLRGIVVPHQILRVEGAGDRLSIPYQVKAVTHVITAAAHMMDVKLRSNFLGQPAGLASENAA